MVDTDEYAATFKLVDADGDGRISAAELHALMRTMGSPITEERAVEAVRAADADGDGLISLEEFAVFLSTHRVS
ncbi:EF-hand domain-containing protein [Spongiactinospora sp. TRM90649]|uniref:EF-hand domain-containing protein n=1 Tax=Spongiactinospora sp. TRM90649 TaxID=3031114 RepID=UPI0023F861BF|nr:EF-hand domain-containing protein [Spongiactinospora sp. TRM90649]MDF5753247.1 EF-hand domain-containing protein [Spongiactinospora sp. TRM90649]